MALIVILGLATIGLLVSSAIYRGRALKGLKKGLKGGQQDIAVVNRNFSRAVWLALAGLGVAVSIPATLLCKLACM